MYTLITSQISQKSESLTKLKHQVSSGLDSLLVSLGMDSLPGSFRLLTGLHYFCHCRAHGLDPLLVLSVASSPLLECIRASTHPPSRHRESSLCHTQSSLISSSASYFLLSLPLTLRLQPEACSISLSAPVSRRDPPGQSRTISQVTSITLIVSAEFFCQGLGHGHLGRLLFYPLQVLKPPSMRIDFSIPPLILLILYYFWGHVIKCSWIHNCSNFLANWIFIMRKISFYSLPVSFAIMSILSDKSTATTAFA